MLKHQYSAEFKKATNKEFEALLAKGTFKYIKASEIDSKAQVIPLMWIFTYKIDQDGSLLKYKAQLVVQGGLQYIEEDVMDQLNFLQPDFR